MNKIENVKKGDLVRFLPDVATLGLEGSLYEVEAFELDTVYLIDNDGSSFTAETEEIELL